MTEAKTDARQIWSYGHPAMWSRVDDPLPSGSHENEEKRLRAGGYFNLGQFPHSDASVFLEVYEHDDAEKWFVIFNTYARWYPVLVTSLPALLDLLERGFSVVERFMRMDDAGDKHEAELECRRQERAASGVSMKRTTSGAV